MTESSERPPRRKRYSGKYPRKFAEKYKELDPSKYAETVAKVIASGKTPAGTHVPIMVEECMDALRLGAGMVGVDCTLGYGGHARQILERIRPGGRLIGLDRDGVELPKTEQRMRELGYDEKEFSAVLSNYAGIGKVMNHLEVSALDFVFADLGCSSMQLDDPVRGFSFKHHGPLDMRMNPERGISAADWLEKVGPEKLAQAFLDNSDEPRAEQLAQGLAGKRFADTKSLAQEIRSILGVYAEEAKELAVRRVFQAIRIEINEEFSGLDAFLRVLPNTLRSGGRVAILTFHSGEDRRVKKSFQMWQQAGVFAEVSETVILASPDERRMNPRSIPAKLRWAMKA